MLGKLRVLTSLVFNCICLIPLLTFLYLYLFSKAAKTKYHIYDGSSSRNSFSHSSGFKISKINMLTELASPEASILGLQMVTHWLPVHMVFPLCICSLCNSVSRLPLRKNILGIRTHSKRLIITYKGTVIYYSRIGV